MEQASAKVLSDLTGQEYNARVEKIDDNPETNSAYRGKATMYVHVEKPYSSALETESDRTETTEVDCSRSGRSTRWSGRTTSCAPHPNRSAARYSVESSPSCQSYGILNEGESTIKDH